MVNVLITVACSIVGICFGFVLFERMLVAIIDDPKLGKELMDAIEARRKRKENEK